MAQPTMLHFDPGAVEALWPRNAGLVAFYFPGTEEPWDKLCGCSFLGNFYPSKILLAGCQYKTAEAAFQALKFGPEYFARFSLLGTGDEAFKLKRQLERQGLADPSFTGRGSNWGAMLEVLRSKFHRGSSLAAALLGTGDAFLLEHNSVAGRDAVWSDNHNGEGMNWLGMQLMLVRDELASKKMWTRGIQDVIDVSSGQWRRRVQWQSLVRAASQQLGLALRNAQSGTGAPFPGAAGLKRPPGDAASSEQLSKRRRI